MRLLHTTWPLFQAFRVNVRVSWTVAIWPVIFGVAFSKWLPYEGKALWGHAVLWGVVWTVGLFTTVWVHEMGHIAMGRRCGIETELISLRGLGGLAHLSAPAQTPQDDIRIALAGPATHFLWMAVLFPLVWLTETAGGSDVWWWMLRGFAHYQISMMVFNLLPVYPMDGGRALRAALSLRIHPSTASWHTATVGYIGNGAFLVVGVLAWTGIADPLGYELWGVVLVGLGLEGIRECRRLRLEAKYGGTYEDQDPFQRTLLASQAAVREMERDESSARAAPRPVIDPQQQLQDTVDRLLDRINEVGGIEKLSAKERRELERASKALAERG